MPRPLRFIGERHSLGLYYDSAKINNLLGIGDWYRQYDILIGARTKRSAALFAGKKGMNLREQDLAILTGNNIQEMAEAGLLSEGEIYVLHEGRGPIVHVVAPGQYKIIGKLERT